jgi:hypothetical protein
MPRDPQQLPTPLEAEGWRLVRKENDGEVVVASILVPAETAAGEHHAQAYYHQ